MPVTTTLNEIRSFEPCIDGWKMVLKAHEHLGLDTEFPVSSILDSNNINDVLWVLNKIPETKNLLLTFNLWCVRQVEHLMEDQRSKDTLVVLEKYINGEASDEELVKARRNACAAYYDSDDSAAASAAAYAAAYAVSVNAASATVNAVNAASDDDHVDAYKSMREKQVEKLRELLNE